MWCRFGGFVELLLAVVIVEEVAVGRRQLRDTSVPTPRPPPPPTRTFQEGRTTDLQEAISFRPFPSHPDPECVITSFRFYSQFIAIFFKNSKFKVQKLLNLIETLI